MVSHIAVLPSAVADQIAAGEVVERPASVVKELLENALDAGATSVDIDVLDGGRERIRISDDGCGMSRPDALLALERHATSKIRTASDLVGVRTFGFRGEALPAICSVSHLMVETATDAGQSDGTRIRASGGAVEDVEDIARRRGTTITVSKLFYNAPARFKFMRGTRSEWRAIVDLVSQAAYTMPGVRLTLVHDGRMALNLPPANTLRARVSAVLGAEYAERLLDVDDVNGTTMVSGLIERPMDVGTSGRRIHLAVNGRVVRDGGMVRAAEAAYRSTIPAGVRPTLYLELVVADADVDVNVHPAKAEVRFRDRWTVERSVESAVRRALGTLASAAPLGRGVWQPHGGPGGVSGAGAPGGDGALVDVEMLQRSPASFGTEGLFAPAGGVAGDVASLPDGVTAMPNLTAAPIAPPRLLQLRRTYMLFEHDDGVVLIDQHSAHERVLYERFMRILECGEVPSQRLLFPLTLHLSPADAEAFETHRELLERLGFEVEGFGGYTLIVRSVPMPHPRFDAERCLRDTLAALAGDRSGAAAARHERLAATVACKAAIKAGEALSQDEMGALFTALGRTTLPAHDVHGRATIVQLSWDELERRFGRR